MVTHVATIITFSFMSSLPSVQLARWSKQRTVAAALLQNISCGQERDICH